MALPKAHLIGLRKNGSNKITPIDYLLGIRGKPKNTTLGVCSYLSEVDGLRKTIGMAQVSIALVIEQKPPKSYNVELSKPRLKAAITRLRDGEPIAGVARSYRVGTAYLLECIGRYSKLDIQN